MTEKIDGIEVWRDASGRIVDADIPCAPIVVFGPCAPEEAPRLLSPESHELMRLAGSVARAYIMKNIIGPALDGKPEA